MSATTKRTILVADDDVSMRRIIRKALGTVCPDADVHEVEDGLAAEAAVVTLKPQLLIIDFNMPGLDGLRLCRRMRRRTPAAALKIVMVSGEPLEELRDMALEAGVDAFVAKPFLIVPFMDMVSRLITPTAA